VPLAFRILSLGSASLTAGRSTSPIESGIESEDARFRCVVECFALFSSCSAGVATAVCAIAGVAAVASAVLDDGEPVAVASTACAPPPAVVEEAAGGAGAVADAVADAVVEVVEAIGAAEEPTEAVAAEEAAGAVAEGAADVVAAAGGAGAAAAAVVVGFLEATEAPDRAAGLTGGAGWPTTVPTAGTDFGLGE
jgi:hypothetical protein